MNGLGKKLLFVSSGLFKYPFPTPSPEIYNSPIYPVGTRFLSLSKMYICVLSKGFPINLVKSSLEEKLVKSLGSFLEIQFKRRAFS